MMDNRKIIKPVKFDEDIIGKKFISFSVPGEPFAKQRPRAARKGRFITIYTPKPTKDYESKVRNSYKEIYQNEYYNQNRLTGPLVAKVEAVFEAPKSVSNKEREFLESGQPHIKKPDCDNIAKVCLDALNGIVYEDDSIIDTLIVNKKYGKKEKVDITIYEKDC
jgi:Holliday junction resolvase RusA-like endonuclease